MYVVCLGKGEGGGDGNEVRRRVGIRLCGVFVGVLGYVLGRVLGVIVVIEGLAVETLLEFCGERCIRVGVWGIRGVGREEVEWRFRKEFRLLCFFFDFYGVLGGFVGFCIFVFVLF